MLNRSFIIIFIFLILLTSTVAEKVHYHAGFLVYVDGKVWDFSDIKYMDIKPCRLPSASETDEDDQKEKAHLHDGVADVVHVEGSGAIWADLFENINFAIPQDKPIKGYSNRTLISNILSSSIEPYQSVVIVIGDDAGVDLSRTVSVEHIKEAESSTETC